MRKPLYILSLLLVISPMVILYAQDKPERNGLGDMMRGNGRIYVVAAVMLTILVGLILYLIRLDRKISNLEKDNKQ